MTRRSIEVTTVAERRRLRFELDGADLGHVERSARILGQAESYDAHARRWKLTLSGNSVRPSGWRKAH